MTLETRFWSKVNKTDTCWLWMAAALPAGYGLFYTGVGVPQLAHRVAYRLTTGEIPADSLVMHSCDNPRCVNPAHLSIGTNADNKLDAVAKRRHAYGERNKGGRSKLDESKVREIKLRLKSESARSIAKSYQVDPEIVRGIKLGLRWKHVA